MAAVAGLEGDLVGATVWGFEPRLQESGQVLHHVILEGLTCSSYLDEKNIAWNLNDFSLDIGKYDKYCIYSEAVSFAISIQA